ncbi:MAG: hypothetical protein AAF939_10865 [Planctomycetota bacterium]
MARKNEPWYWEARKGWYVTLNGKRKKLEAKNKTDAFKEFCKLQVESPRLNSHSPAVIMDEMVEWTGKNRSAGTYRFYREHAQQFLDWLKGEKLVDISCDELTPDIFESYLKSPVQDAYASFSTFSVVKTFHELPSLR